MDIIQGIDIDSLVRKIYVVSPNLPQSDEFSRQMRAKLKEQIKDKVPKVELEHLDLSYIILNVKRSLTDFQKRIDSVVQQQLRRTTRVRKINQDYQDLITESNQKHKHSCGKLGSSTSLQTDKEPNCSTTQINKEAETDLVGLVQVESLPVSASSNLVTIIIPSILQEKLQSVKYKISIDLNRLDLTKRILDFNVSQLESDIKKNSSNVVEVIEGIQRQECKLTYKINDRDNLQLVDETQIAVNNIPQIEIKTPVGESETRASVLIVHEKDAETPTQIKERAQKRKISKRLNLNSPPKKRGRKPGSKNKVKPQKSELAKYVEMFECNGQSPSSAVSQTVTSTTQNWEIMPDQTPQIAYFMNGEWTTLNAASNNVVNTMVTTTNLEDTTENGNCIPFDDFVNFIENPSFDVGNNVIAQVLGDTVNTQEPAITLHHQINDTPMSDANTQTNQNDLPGQKIDDCITLPPPNSQDTNVNSCSKGIKSEALRLISTQENNNNVIFSTCRSMPSLDIEDGDLFCSPPKETNTSDGIIAFSMKPNESSTSHHYRSTKQNENISTSVNNLSIQQTKDILTSDPAINVDRTEILQSLSDTSKDELISKYMGMPSNVKDKNVVIKEMSLLEIENDFDGSLLDFNNCLDDDLLSLAPSSCFNSPMDDRFGDSKFLNIEEPELNSCIESVQSIAVPAPRSHLEMGLVTFVEDEINPALKSFKIPKVKTVMQSNNSPEKLRDKQLLPMSKKTDETISTNKSPLVSVKSSKSQVLQTSTNDLTSTFAKQKQTISSLEITDLFGLICYKFLADMCFESNCRASHQLLDLGIISISVRVLGNEVLNTAYRFIWRNYKLFKFYFPIFCEEYGRRKMRHKLLTMLRDCELQPKCKNFIKNIYANLIGCGLSKVNACRLVLNRAKDKSHSAIDVLLDLIIESDAHMFGSAIEKFSNVDGYKFSMKHINELATVCLRSGSSELVQALIKCLINVDQTDFLTLRSLDLIQLLEVIKSGGDM